LIEFLFSSSGIVMTQSALNGFVIGVDVGGTKVAAGLVDRSGEIRVLERMPMVPTGEAAAGLNAVTSAIDSVSRRSAADPKTQGTIRGIGICSPGPLDPVAGLVINPPNVPCWRNYPLASEVANIYHVPVKLDNDANAAALAEARWGAGRGCQNIFYATIGTGIGSGIVLDGKIFHGRTGAAGEGGHVSIDYRGPRCGCGKRGCIEAYASGPAIARRTREKLTADGNRGSAIHELSSGNLDAISSEMVGQAYAAGDRLATEILQETVELLSAWLGNIVDLLDPEVIIVGGGVAAMLKPFFEEISRRLPQCCINSRAREIPLVMARYGADAGIAGGAALCSEIAG
jgi:glucokinase